MDGVVALHIRIHQVIYRNDATVARREIKDAEEAGLPAADGHNRIALRVYADSTGGQDGDVQDGALDAQDAVGWQATVLSLRQVPEVPPAEICTGVGHQNPMGKSEWIWVLFEGTTFLRRALRLPLP
jgi:hypothetical protein